MGQRRIVRIGQICATIHGEFPEQGRPAVLVRLQGCPVGCAWCDSKKYQPEDGGTQFTVEKLVEKVKSFGLKQVLVTGGEPLHQRATIGFLKSLVKNGFKVVLETDGSHEIKDVPAVVRIVMDIKTPRSGAMRDTKVSNFRRLKNTDVVKIVLKDRKDYNYAKRILARHSKKIKADIIFSPVNQKLAPETLALWLLKDRSNFRMQVQLHKILGLK
jgi:7-carboxy-7-deazaguanine synthase